MEMNFKIHICAVTWEFSKYFSETVVMTMRVIELDDHFYIFLSGCSKRSPVRTYPVRTGGHSSISGLHPLHH